ncbi:FAD dependent oxidoreductase [uncultured Caudovirales phage]|uniref:FAD dependent oxidoreductase n=1 Tax=uncultured Caudovirales phage TaxID=2100421 RepID=A0A6J5L7C6_9CAUD|nr:FAD dependent oxidoreductase [uncultured Caudovirales phage]
MGNKKIIVIGAGIFGVTIALTLDNENFDVTLVEKDNKILNNASMCNHNRLHYGFHYPRSLETAKQSLDGFEIFKSKFENCILNEFKNYYLIDKNSKVSKSQYNFFCNEIGVEFVESYPYDMINNDTIDYSILTKEPVFDYSSIENTLNNNLKNSNVKLILNNEINNFSELSEFDIIINTTYHQINKINNILNVEKINLKFQDVVIPIFEININKIGLTVMDGDFCSVMPKGFEKNTFLLYHVKNSVLKESVGIYPPSEWLQNDENINDNINSIYLESSKYFPFLNDCKKIGFWRTIRALPINNDDGRLSTFTHNIIGGKEIFSVLSGKITTCWLIAEKIKNTLKK